MEFSDDEEELVLQSATSYYFVNDNDIPISFSELPLHSDDSKTPEPPKEQVFLHGNAEDGLQKVFKQVLAWKIGFNENLPEVFVLSKDKKWIKLLKARKSYEELIRTTVVTIHLLHYLKNNPTASEGSLWDHLRKALSTFEVMPSEDDLRDQFGLIRLFSDIDETFGKSELLQKLLLDGTHKRAAVSGVDIKKEMVAKPFITDEVEEASDDGEESDTEGDLYDPVCAICDNGGSILCCDGKCMRSFHALKSSGNDDASSCKTLGFTEAECEAMQIFLCKNCEYNRHQCFACGKLGSSDKSKGAADVYKCVSATCGHFYHPRCVATLLFPENVADASDFKKKVECGESFTCPVHKCIVCKQGENKEDKDLQFAVCRRCPTTYHRKCLPREIAFDNDEEDDSETETRAWDGLLQNQRILIYCLKHEIDDDLGTPARIHIIFPGILKKKNDVLAKNRKVQELVKKKTSIDLREGQASAKSTKASERLSRSSDGLLSRKSGKKITEKAVVLQNKVRISKESILSEPRKNVIPEVTEKRKMAIVKDRGIVSEKANKQVTAVSVPSSLHTSNSSFEVIDVEKEKRVFALFQKIKSSLTLDVIKKERTVPSLYAYSSKLDRNITQGKIEGSIEAISAAVQKIENSETVEDAKAVCEPEMLKQMKKWNNKLKVYLSPFIHGMRYSSYGRHFTKVEKLNEIVDRIHWYVQNGDTIVDFCCGANDFSWIMKQKLDATGKPCSFKNYDLIQPKNDFCFEMRDWMKVQPNELPAGSQLVMGLNPPFGLNAALANKFIDKALTFKPKFLILIVPRETERLDKKASPYDLIWEDCQELSGKSFYLPGSVDTDDKQIEQWNNKPPALYLWSRPDWTAKHQAIAAYHGHEFGKVGSFHGETRKEPIESDVRVRQFSEENAVTRDGNKDRQNKRRRKTNTPANEIMAGTDGECKTAENKRIFPENDKATVSKKSREVGEGVSKIAIAVDYSNIDNRSKNTPKSEHMIEVDGKAAQSERNSPENDKNTASRKIITMNERANNKTRAVGDKDIDNRIRRIPGSEIVTGVEGECKTAQNKRNTPESDKKTVSKKSGAVDEGVGKKTRAVGNSGIVNRSNYIPRSETMIEVEGKSRNAQKKRNSPENDQNTVSKKIRAVDEGVNNKTSAAGNNMESRIKSIPGCEIMIGVEGEYKTAQYKRNSPQIDKKTVGKKDHGSEAYDIPMKMDKDLHNISGSKSDFGMPGGSRNVTAFSDDVDEIAKKYMRSGGPHNLPGSNFGGSDNNGLRSLEERMPSYTSGIGYKPHGRTPYSSNYDAYGRASETDMLLKSREYDLRRTDDLARRSMYSLDGLDNKYSSPASALNFSSVAGSTMQKYMPRLDEMNSTRPGPLGPDMPLSRGDLPPNSMGLHGSQQMYPNRGSSGWFNK